MSLPYPADIIESKTVEGSTLTAIVKPFTSVELPFLDENGVPFVQNLTPVCYFILDFHGLNPPLPFPNSIPYVLRIWRGDLTIGTLTGQAPFAILEEERETGIVDYRAKFGQVPGPFVPGTEYQTYTDYGGTIAGLDNAIVGTPFFQCELKGGERIVLEFPGHNVTPELQVFGNAQFELSPLFYQNQSEVPYGQDTYEDKVQWIGLRVETEPQPGFASNSECGYYVPTSPNKWKRDVCAITNNAITDNGWIPIAAASRIGYRDAPLSGVRALYQFQKSEWGGTVWKKIVVNDPIRESIPNTSFFVVNGADELTSSEFRRSVAGVFETGGTNSPTIATFTTEGLLVNLSDFDLSPPRYISCLSADPSGTIWVLHRFARNGDLPNRYTGPWRVQRVPFTFMSAQNLNDDDYLETDETLWEDQSIVYADLQLLRDGGACSVALQVFDDGAFKLLFKRAPAPNGPWPNDADAVVVRSKDANSLSGTLPNYSYRIYERGDGTLYLIAGFGLITSNDGGKTWP